LQAITRLISYNGNQYLTLTYPIK